MQKQDLQLADHLAAFGAAHAFDHFGDVRDVRLIKGAGADQGGLVPGPCVKVLIVIGTGYILTGHILTGHILTGHILTGHILTGHILTGRVLTGRVLKVGHRHWHTPSARELQKVDDTTLGQPARLPVADGGDTTAEVAGDRCLTAQAIDDAWQIHQVKMSAWVNGANRMFTPGE